MYLPGFIFPGPPYPHCPHCISLSTTSPGLQNRATPELFSDAGALQALTLENGIFFETSLKLVLKLLDFHLF